MEIKIIYEVSTKEKTVVIDNTLEETRRFAMGLLKSDAVKNNESLFIRQKIYVDGVFEEDTRIDFFFKHPIDGIECCFRREDSDPVNYFDFFLKEEE